MDASPKPSHGDLVVIAPEFSLQKGFPDDFQECGPRMLLHPFIARDFLVLFPVVYFSQVKGLQAETNPVQEGEGSKLKKLQGGPKGIEFSLVSETHLAGEPMEAVTDAQFIHHFPDAGVTGKNMVVILFQGGSGHWKAGRQAADMVGSFKDLDLVPGFGKTVSGGQTRYARTDNSDPHGCAFQGALISRFSFLGYCFQGQALVVKVVITQKGNGEEYQ